MQYNAMRDYYEVQNKEGAYTAYYERPATISLVGDVAGLRVLEVGCGPGVLTSWLADHGAAVTAIDISEQMIRLARRRVGDRARILEADLAEPLSFAADASMDLIVASLVLHYVADWTAVFGEFHRILATGGVVVFSTHHPAMDWQMHSRDDYFAVKQVTEVWDTGGKPFEVTFWRRPLRTMTQSITNAGFVIDQLLEPDPIPELSLYDHERDMLIRNSPTFLFFRLIKRLSDLR